MKSEPEIITVWTKVLTDEAVWAVATYEAVWAVTTYEAVLAWVAQEAVPNTDPVTFPVIVPAPIVNPPFKVTVPAAVKLVTLMKL